MESKYDISKTYNSFGGGISDDEFIGSENQVADISGIDIRTNSRFIVANGKFQTSSQVSIGAVGNATGIKYTPYGIFTWDANDVYLGIGNVTGTVGAPTNSIEYGGTSDTVTDQINYTFNPTSIKKMNYDCSSTLATIAIAGGAVSTTAWHITNILYAQKNVVSFLSTVTDTTAVGVTLVPGTRVIKIYSYSTESIIVVGVRGNDTTIYELEFTGGAYNIVRKVTIVGYKALDAVGDKYSLYWLSIEGIHQYQGGQSLFVKKVALTTDAKCSYYKGLLLVADGFNYYRYGATKPGYPAILDKVVSDYSISALEKDYIATFSGSNRYYDQLTAGGYYLTNTIDLIPIDGGIFEIPKHDLYIRYGYINPLYSSYTDAGVRCEIQIQIKTDERERNGGGWITLDTNSQDSYGYIELGPTTISKILETNGLKSEWGYAKIRIIEKSGDAGSGFYRKTSKIFDLTIKANYVKR